ncbi:hypothetical protein P8452_15517 [Trifolium repens]|nr:hypothetical protein P8452_15517 [Trifolium repens]
MLLEVLSLVLRETCFCIFPCRSINLVYQSKVIPKTKSMFIDPERERCVSIFSHINVMQYQEPKFRLLSMTVMAYVQLNDIIY